jgi:uncharacterized protein YchJ
MQILIKMIDACCMHYRYSAFAKKEVRYIVKTTHKDNPAMKGSRNDELDKNCRYMQSCLVPDLLCECL